jgi:hypothetical protein
VDLSPVLDYLAAMRGDTTTTLAMLLASLAGIRTLNTLSLQDAIDAATAVRGSGNPTVHDVLTKLSSIQPTGTNSIDSILTKVISTTAMQAIIDAAVLALAGEAGATIVAVKDVANDIKALVEALGAPTVPPVWTTTDQETLGSEQALVDGLDLSGPMDGILIAITAHPPGAGVFGFGDMRSWGHAGAVAFRTDRGDYEWPISLGPQNQVITPRSMRVAAGARVRLGNGFHGTARTFSASGGG